MKTFKKSRRSITRLIPFAAILAEAWHMAKATATTETLTMLGGKENAYSAETVTFAFDETTQNYAVGG